jgi:hypothetical protein
MTSTSNVERSKLQEAMAMKATTSHAWTSMERAIFALEVLAAEAPSSRELAAYWRDFERRLLAELREAERTLLPRLAHPPDAEQMLAEHERIRSLAWQVAITTDLGCFHVRIIRQLGALLRERAARTQPPTPSRGVSFALAPN